MATKKASNNGTTKTTNPAPTAIATVPAVKSNRQIIDEKFPAHPPRARELIAEAMGRKLTKDEIGELRTFRLKKDGSTIAPHTGPRNKAEVNAVAIANVIEFAGIDGLKKMHDRHGKSMKRAFYAYVKTVAEGDDRTALEALSKSFFPSQRRGFTKSDDQKVSKSGRVAVLVSDVASAGSRVKREVVTLADGRRGLFVWAVPDAAPASQDTPTAPVAAPSWSASPAPGANA